RHTRFSRDWSSDVCSSDLQLEKVDEEGRIFHSHQIAQENHEKRITTKSYIEGINKILKRENVYGENEHYVASPTYIDGFLVFTEIGRASCRERVENREVSD